MLEFIDKSDFERLESRVRDFVSRLEAVKAVEVARDGQSIDLSGDDERVLQTYARQCDGSVIRVGELRGGYSSTRVLRARVSKAGGAQARLVVARLAGLEETLDEVARYRQYVAGTLPHGSHVVLAGDIRAGAGDRGGVFYTLLEGFDESLFDVLHRDPTEAAARVEELRSRLSNWSAGSPTRTLTLGDVRRELTRDEELAERLVRIPPELAARYQAAEEVTFETRYCPRHGDLHGDNILVRADHGPVIIDYARVGEGACALDPVILELSLLLHPSKPLGEDPAWPSTAQLGRWAELETFVEGSPYQDYVVACRTWAHAVSAGDREVAAAAICYVIRQLKYDHVQPDLAAHLLTGMLGSLGA